MHRRLCSRSVRAAQRRSYCESKNIETIALHGGWVPDATTSVVPPVYRTSSYVFESPEKAANLFALKELGNIYTRIMNPTQDVLEKKICMMEGAHPLGGLALASGTSAVFYSIINLAKTGDNIIAARNMYGGTHTMFQDILPYQFGIECRLVDVNDPQNVANAIDSKTRCVFAETVSNPALDITDQEALAEICKGAGIPLAIDSTFTTPHLNKPLDHGANMVIHSLTKWIGGHGNAIGGIVIDGGNFNWAGGNHPVYDEPAADYHGLRWGHDLPEMLAPLAYVLRMRTGPLRNLGACLSPDNAWMFMQGLETLSLRMEKHCSNALKVAEFLKDHPKVEYVRYPGLAGDKMNALNQKYLKGKGGGMVVPVLKGGKAAGQKFIESLVLHRHLANVGDARSLAIHPATTTHSQLSEQQLINGGTMPGLVRLSVGIEHPDDIIQDLDQALAKVN